MRTGFIKLIASAIALTAYGGSLFAQDAESGERDSMTFTYAGYPSGGYGYSAACWCGGAMLFTENLTQRFDNCEITAVEIANGDFHNQNSAPFEIFFTDDLGKPAFLSLKAKMDIRKPKEYKTYVLPEPLKISAGNPFYAGYTVRTEGANSEHKSSISVFVDNRLHTDKPGGFIGRSETSGKPENIEWEDEGYSMGMVCIRLIIEGNSLPKNLAKIKWSKIPDVVSPGTTSWPDFEVTNLGINPVSSVDIAYTVNGKSTSRNISFNNPPISYDSKRYMSIPLELDKEGVNMPIDIILEKVNGVEQQPSELTMDSGSLHCIDPKNGFSRNMLVEEGTGTGCGWCVRGIVGFDRTFKAHNDGSFIPVAVHSRYYNALLTPIGYDPLWDILTQNPTCLINRNLGRFSINDPSYDALGMNYDITISIPAICDIELLECSLSGKSLEVASEVTFALAENDADYTIAYVVTENNVGPYMQANAYSGSDADMDGWEDQDSRVETYFDFVARGISNYHGTPGDIPGTIQPRVRYSHSDEVPISKVNDLYNTAVIGMVINKKTGCIENSVRRPISELMDFNGIEEIHEDAPVEYYDLQGRRINGKPSDGIYIRRQGTDVSKVMIH